MKFGKTDLCDVLEIKGRYQVTWGRHVTGLKLYSEKVHILIDMLVKDSKSWEVGILLNTGMVVWVNRYTLSTIETRDFAEYLWRIAGVKSHEEISGAIFDNTNDVETFVDRLEKKYIVHVLKR
jgi:hypothetical protein